PSTRLDWVPAEVDVLLAALTARDPDDRPSDAQAALDLLRRTRSALDDATLARRADVAPTEEDEEEPATGATDVTPLSGGTVALPIGAIPADAAATDGATAGPRRRRRRRTGLALVLLALLLAVAGGGSW